MPNIVNEHQMDSGARVEFANTLRGLAALTVLVSHHFGVFWFARDAIANFVNAPALTELQAPTPVFIGWLWPVPNYSWGLYGVALFFLISGFVIPFSLAKSTMGAFGIGRFFRIVPTYVAGFSITLLSIFLSTRYFGTQWTYETPDILIHYLPGLRDLVGTRSFDGIIWTLEIEVKFYLVCALAIALLRHYRKTVFLIPVALFVIAIWVGSSTMSGYFAGPTTQRLWLMFLLNAQFIVFMFIGVAFHYMYKGILKPAQGYFVVMALFSMFCIQWSAGPHSGAFSQVWNYGLALLTFQFAYTWPSVFRSNRVFNFLADISYPLYVVHGVAGFAALRILADQKMRPLPSLLLVTAGCILVAWLLHIAVEVPGQRWSRAWMKAHPQTP
jgi:peptidoglycan/LPS O-acetylase OafA/YrhL